MKKTFGESNPAFPNCQNKKQSTTLYAFVNIKNLFLLVPMFPRCIVKPSCRSLIVFERNLS